MRRVLGPSRLGSYELGIQRVSKSGDDFVLHVEQIDERFVETLGPDMMARFDGYQLHIHPNSVATPLHRALEHVADIQLSADLLEIYGLPLVGKRGVPSNDEQAADARQVGGQALGHSI